MIYNRDCIDILPNLDKESIDLIITSPPYNIGKEYEESLILEEYKEFQKKVISECSRLLKNTGSLFWEIGTYIKGKKIIPLDILLFDLFIQSGLIFKNRIIWHFEYGLHSTKKLSGRYETVLWFVKSEDYVFNLDEIRVPQKYPRKKHFKGPKKGEYSCNPLGKNPVDVWKIPNVVHNHPEKTSHPCQFPEELIRRLVLGFSNKGDIVLDPFGGSGTTGVICEKLGRESILIEKEWKYCEIAEDRIKRVKEQATLDKVTVEG